MNGYEFLSLTLQLISTGMSIDEAYNTAKETCETLADIPSGSFIDAA